MCWPHLVAGCIAVIGVQVLVLAAGDSRMFSGSDAGGRAASVAAAAENGGCDHDLGYWASDADPSGRFHPIINSEPVTGRYVQPASIPFVCAAAPVVRALGLPWATWVSMAGVVAAALGAALLERSTGSAGWLSFVLVGVVGPVAFYGTDIWEARASSRARHPRDGDDPVPSRTVVGRVRRGAVGAGDRDPQRDGHRRDRPRRRGRVGTRDRAGALVGERWRVLLLAAATGAVLFVDRVLQQSIVGTDYRGGRASSQVSGAFAGLGDRVRDATVTTFGLFPTDSAPMKILVGVAFVGVLVVRRVHRSSASGLDPRLVRAFRGVAVVTAVLRSVNPGFVPGLFAAAPVAAVGIFAVRRAAQPVARVLAIGSLVALPAIWAVQWSGNLAPQWGGRYELLNGALLTVCGSVMVGPHLRAWPARAVLVSAVAIGSMGLVWHVQRTDLFAGVLDDIGEIACDDVLVSTSPYLLREGGAFPEIQSGVRPDGCRLLSTSLPELDEALDVAGATGATEVAVLVIGPRGVTPGGLAGVRVVSADQLDLNGFPYMLYRVDVNRPGL